MNLIKFFNYKFLKENIKKSKNLIILLLTVVPLLTTLFTILFMNEENKTIIASQMSISWINIVGMYIVPIGISFALFGYIYKKNSVDLINSMPINKQTLFITNSIGGIILITLMQIITTILLFVCSIACRNLVIFGNMLIDLFIIMTISYIFIFLVTNCAMSISGTFCTQLVLTALILFLIPCISMYFDLSSHDTYQIINNQKIIGYCSYDKTYNLPVNTTLSSFMSLELYSIPSLVKTIILGLIYYLLGLFLFKKRKMEDVEESFRSEKIHLFVKGLTIFPMVLLLNLVSSEKIITIFVLAIITVYYFVYDFIVKRKIKLLISLIALVVTIFSSYIMIKGIEIIQENIIEPSKKIQIEDIKEVSIDLSTGGGNRNNKIYSYFMNNKEIIEMIKNTQRIGYDSEKIYSVGICYKTNFGKKVNSSLLLDEESFYYLIELLSKDEKYVNLVKSDYMKNGKICINENVIPSELETTINTLIKNEIEKKNLGELYEDVIMNDNYYDTKITKENYYNHKSIEKRININLSEELKKLVIKYQNELSVEMIKNTTEENIHVNYVREDCQNNAIIYSVQNHTAIIDFIKENATVECDINQKIYRIVINNWDNNTSSVFYTNKIDELKDELIIDVEIPSQSYIY